MARRSPMAEVKSHQRCRWPTPCSKQRSRQRACCPSEHIPTKYGQEALRAASALSQETDLFSTIGSHSRFFSNSHQITFLLYPGQDLLESRPALVVTGRVLLGLISHVSAAFEFLFFKPCTTSVGAFRKETARIGHCEFSPRSHARNRKRQPLRVHIQAFQVWLWRGHHSGLWCGQGGHRRWGPPPQGPMLKEYGPTVCHYRGRAILALAK